jgi:hypothetical protein
MKKKNSEKLCAWLLIIIFAAALLHLPFSLYGQDGYGLWYPIISEYLKGSEFYHRSDIVFGGQNLAGIYGELPFWKIFRLLNLKIESFLNLTHVFFVMLFFSLTLSIVKGLKKTLDIHDILILFLFSFFSPVIMNRVMAGHLNLLFGVLPFFSLVSIIFNKSKQNIFLNIVCFWCALSTQAFQILAYHLFYLPLLFIILKKYENDKKRYFITVTSIFFIAFALNFPNFLEMLNHAFDSNNYRTLDKNMVYTYTVSSLMDLPQFIISSLYPSSLIRSVGFYHEISYPTGGFLVLFFANKIDKQEKILISGFFLVMFLFCMNVAGINLLSDLPVIKAFRVPQRVFMIFSLFIPIWVYGLLAEKNHMTKKENLIFLVCLLLSPFIPYSDLLCLSILILFWGSRLRPRNNWVLYISFFGLLSGGYDKILPSAEHHAQYTEVRNLLIPLLGKFNKAELRHLGFHFETTEPLLVNYVAQTLGIKTIEGYGHPPAQLVSKIEKNLGIDIPDGSNTLYLNGNYPGKDSLLKELGVRKKISFGLKNEIKITDL